MTLLFGTFLEGLLSFLSPCVLPLIPLYMSYLTSDYELDTKGNKIYDQKKTVIRTIFFILGILTVFLILMLSISFVSEFIEEYRVVIQMVGSFILILFGLHELGVIEIAFLNEEYRLKSDTSGRMNVFKAYAFGFIFAFGWSPCIGPLLSNAILLAMTETNGFLYLLMYAVGLTLPFLVTGLFTNYVLNLIKEKKKIVSYVLKVAGVVLILFGLNMFKDSSQSIISMQHSGEIEYMTFKTTEEDFKLSKYKGKYVFLNFTTTWCTYCEAERPEYEKFKSESDAVCLYVMSPLHNGGSVEDIYNHSKENNYKVPIIIDEEGVLFNKCNITGYPTIWIIGPDGSFIGYMSGLMDFNGFNNIYAKAIERYESGD